MSSAKGDEVDELVVVEIKKFVWRKWQKGTRVAGSVCERCIPIFTSLMELTSLRTERLMLPTPPWPLRILSPTAPLAHHAQLNELCRDIPSSIAYFAFQLEQCIFMNVSMSAQNLIPPHGLNLDIALGQSNLSPFFPSAGLLLAV